MIYRGFLGGPLGYFLLRHITDHVGSKDPCSGAVYAGRSKMEVLFGPQIWERVSGLVVMDFGCGFGFEAIEMARHGAKKVIGIDIRESVLKAAREAADRAGVADRCVFATDADEQADVIFSIDGFEHYDRPGDILASMRQLVKDDGRIVVSFGPPWCHPLGGHLFSIFPWAHLIFSEHALLRWWSDFKFDGATRFAEIEGGLNEMTVGGFRRLLERSEFEITRFEAVPIKRFRWLANPLTREFLTSIVQCELAPRRRGA